jgi:hypothetical protein
MEMETEKTTAIKVKKRWKRLVAGVLFALLGLIVLIPVAANIPFVQTLVVRYVTGVIEEQLQTRVSIKSVNISFFNRVTVNKIYVEDLTHDTLLYVERLDASISKLPSGKQPLTLNKIRLNDGIFRLRSDSAGANVSQIIRRISTHRDSIQQQTDSDSVPLTVRVKALELRNFRYTMLLTNAQTIDEQPEGIIYKNMSVAGINLDADRISIVGDMLSFRVNELSFAERSGFNVNRISADTGIIRFGREVTLKEFRLTDDFSDIRMRRFSMEYDSGDKFSDFVNNVRLTLDVYDSDVSFATLAFFAPVLGKVAPLTVKFQGYVSGPVANFRSDDFELFAPDNTYINGRFSISGLPDIESAMIFADLRETRTNTGDVFKIVSRITDSSLDDWELLRKAENIDFRGTFTGFISEFVAHGSLQSAFGSLNMDMSCKTHNSATTLSGALQAVDFDLGKLLDSPLLGFTNCDFTLNGDVKRGSNDIFGKGTVSSLEFNRYTYRNISFEGRMLNQSFDGLVNFAGDDLKLNFKGNIDLAGKNDHIPVFDFDADLRHADLCRLNFNTRDSVSQLQAHIKANFKASSILNYVGDLNISDVHYTDIYGDNYIGDISLSSFNRDSHADIRLTSAFMDARYRGDRDLNGFVGQITALCARYFPALGKFSGTNYVGNDSLSIHVKKASEFIRALLPGLQIADNSTLNVAVDTAQNLRLKLRSGQIAWNSNSIADLQLTASNSRRDSLNLALSGDLSVGGVNLTALRIDNAIADNTVVTDLAFTDTLNKSDAKISLRSQFAGSAGHSDFSAAINMSRSDVTIFGQAWTLAPTLATIKPDNIGIEGFNLYRRGQNIKIDGVISASDNDTLLVNIDRYRLAGLNSYLAQRGYRLFGAMSGNIELTGAYSVPKFMGNLQADTVVVNRDTLGSVAIECMWDDVKRLFCTARVYDGKNINSVNLYYVPENGEMSGNCKISNMKLSLLTPLLSGILSDVDGVVDGNLNIKGSTRDLGLSGLLQLKNAGMTVDYLKTRYIVNTDINVSGSRFSISNGTVRDIENNVGSLFMDLTHDNFRNIQFDGKVNIRNLMSLNTRERDNSLFYGKAYASGVVNFKGTPDRINFNITAETNANTLLNIPLSSTSEAKEFEFLSFTGVADTTQTDGETPPDDRLLTSNSGISVNFDLNVTPESEIKILIDPKTGDILRARGSGNLKINVDPALELFSITGDYIIENGDYNFPLPNFSIVAHKFLIDKGSNIHFNGDVTNAILNVTASYRERVSLAPLFPDDSMRNHNVVCQVVITDRMTQPKLKFNIDIQDIDPEKRAQFLSMVNTEEKMTKQFLALLILKSFMPEQNFATQDLGSTSFLANATNLLSSQISNLVALFNLPVPLDINVDYNANTRSNAGSEYEVDFSTQLFDRVLINGSASNATQSNRSFVGNFEAEVLLDKYGSSRFKAFSKSRDYFSDDMENNRNGIGVSYQSQFDKFTDLFRRKKKKDKGKDAAEVGKKQK